LGFQVTFFRSRTGFGEDNPSRFAPRQILFAHTAISDPALGRLLHDERVARAGFGLVQAQEGNTHVRIDDWSLRQANDRYTAIVVAQDFRLELAFYGTQRPLLEGESGYSQKGPDPESASYYYSLPQLRVSGTVTREGKTEAVTGTAWFDHEWSSTLLDKEAVGWDWIGINLDDGGALMAFQIRAKDGRPRWAAATYRRGDGSIVTFRQAQVVFTPLRNWRSSRTGVSYPVAYRVRAGEIELTLTPLMDDQELDSRASVGSIYWEGAVRASQGDKQVGRGYLELTGYWRPLRQ
jgi:predicted secreted hydrolase